MGKKTIVVVAAVHVDGTRLEHRRALYYKNLVLKIVLCRLQTAPSSYSVQ
jgi:hypothetical protein